MSLPLRLCDGARGLIPRFAPLCLAGVRAQYGSMRGVALVVLVRALTSVLSATRRDVRTALPLKQRVQQHVACLRHRYAFLLYVPTHPARALLLCPKYHSDD